MSKELPILLLAYFYPPLGGSASLRAEKLARYLPDYGIAPFILSARGSRYPIHEQSIPSAPRFLAAAHEPPRLPHWLKLLLGKGGEKPVEGRNGTSSARKDSLEKILNWIMFPDTRVGWLPGAVQLGIKTVRKMHLQAIISTAPPYTSHIAGALISHITGVPLLLDYRDAWSSNPFRRPPTALHAIMAKGVERWCGGQADAVVGVTAPMVDDLRSLLGENHIYQHIPNGYDESDFAGQPPPPQKGALTIVYAGTFYGTRLPVTLFRALAELVTEGGITPADIHIILLGDHPPAIRSMAPVSISSLLEWRGTQSHAVAVSTMAGAHVNWLVIGEGSGAGTTATGKLYEYLRAPGQILAHIPEGVAAEIIREHSAGLVLAPDDVQGTKTALKNMLAEHQREELLKARSGDISRYERRSIAGQMAELVRLVVR